LAPHKPVVTRSYLSYGYSYFKAEGFLMQLDDRSIPTDTSSSEPIHQQPVKPLPKPKTFPWGWVIGLLVGIPASAIGLLVGGLFLINWLVGPIDPCGGIGNPEAPPQQQSSPRKAP
jgi:hypothetical protein